MDDSGRKRSILIPIIYAVFFVCVTTGGVFLIIYAFLPHLSQPWLPTAAFALIGFTWIFWLLTYIYSCIKHYFRRDVTPNVARQTTRKASISASTREPAGNPSNHQHDANQDSSVAPAPGSDTTPP